MEVLETIRTRRSIRKYRREKIPDSCLEKILEAARWAPSAKNAQPWNFIVLKNEEIRKKVAEATTFGKFLASAPLGICVIVDPEKSNHPVEDGSAATQNILLAAHSLGLGACWIGSYDSVYEESVKEILKVPKGKRLLSIVSIGFPAESPTSIRKKLDKLVFIDRYGQTP
jgi:nitroreductase